MPRAFLDANALFSAAYREASGLMRLWKLPNAELVTSAYAAEEARRNLPAADQRARLEDLLAQTRIVTESDAPLFRPESSWVGSESLSGREQATSPMAMPGLKTRGVEQDVRNMRTQLLTQVGCRDKIGSR